MMDVIWRKIEFEIIKEGFEDGK
jgi:hypothetical protein